MNTTVQSPLGTNKLTARLAGLFYFLFIATSVLADRFAQLGFGDAGEIAAGITAHAGLFRLGFITALVSALFFLLAAWALFVLLRTVNQDLALLFLLLNLVGVAIQCFSLLNVWAGMLLHSSAEALKAFPPEQLQALEVFFASLYKNGFTSAQLFFGAWLLPLGYLVYKSGFLPRVLGVLLILDFFGVLIWFTQFFFFPEYKVITYPGIVISALAEISLTLWLLIMGIKEQKAGALQAADPVEAGPLSDQKFPAAS